MARDEASTLDWATQAWLNLAALIDGEQPRAGVILKFLEQAPADVKATARRVRADAAIPASDRAEPHLGLATTHQLLDEIASRIDTDYALGGGGLDYTTVGGRPDSYDIPAGPFTRRTPQMGDMVRVDSDPGFGIKGSISRVEELVISLGVVKGVILYVAGRRFHLNPDEVTVVTYDNDTRTWAEVPA